MSVFTVLGRAFFFLLLAFITYLTVAPNPPESESGFAATRFLADMVFGDAGHADKIGHFLAYGALGTAAVGAVFKTKQFWMVPAILALYGAGLEGVQYFVDSRSADLLDALANALGAIAGFIGTSWAWGIVFKK